MLSGSFFVEQTGGGGGGGIGRCVLVGVFNCPVILNQIHYLINQII